MSHARYLFLSLIALVMFLKPQPGAAAASVQAQVFENQVVVSPFADGTYWYLRSPLRWEAFDHNEVTVPAGFVTDFASIPRPLWNILPKWEKYGPAAIVHDFLYWDQSYSRAMADRYLLEAMRDSKVFWLKRGVIYAAVRLFGGFSWRGNLQDKQEHHPRIVPAGECSNPSETWERCEHQIEQPAASK